MAQLVTRRWTIDDLDVFPRPDLDIRYEIIDGELFVSHQPSLPHQITANRCAVALTIWNDRTGLGEVVPAPGVVFDIHNGVAPDVVWISHARLAGHVDQAGHLTRAPELMVEVLSPGATNRRRDLQIKLKLYAERGVLEYWVLDPPVRTVEVYRRVGDDLALARTLGAADTITSPLLPGFAAVVAALFPREERAR